MIARETRAAPPAAAYAVETRGLSKRYPGAVALNTVTMAVPTGQVRAIIGPNGAGKSTLFAAITGLIAPDEGSVHINGRETTGLPAYAVARLGVARAFQVARLFPKLSARENVLAAVLAKSGGSLRFWRPLRSMRAQHAETARLIEEVGLQRYAGRQAALLSQGDKKRLEIAMALALEPSTLLLDEPTAGMSPDETRQTVALVRDLWREHGLTVVLTEHDMSVVFALAQEITVLHRGEILVSGEPQTVRRDPRVVEVYLGEEH